MTNTCFCSHAYVHTGQLDRTSIWGPLERLLLNAWLAVHVSYTMTALLELVPIKETGGDLMGNGAVPERFIRADGYSKEDTRDFNRGKPLP